MLSLISLYVCHFHKSVRKIPGYYKLGKKFYIFFYFPTSSKSPFLLDILEEDHGFKFACFLKNFSIFPVLHDGEFPKHFSLNEKNFSQFIFDETFINNNAGDVA
ncbi:hypothetical protein CHS0354_003610 [Potamilus streckersoni]|uniref:Uncharacterized protein n=1 Tax=Potamilus streckersoni TaxID=2493646 RepID=A0AAE0VR28_9BIVA|nr:hypothetical protein CHS0354_003610 [Potamilus streckersoni]